MTALAGAHVSVDDYTSIRSTVRTLVDSLNLPDSPNPVVVPELSYPFHPSTGLVTNPDVTDAVVGALQESLETNVDLVYPNSKYADGTRTAKFVGYDEVTGRTGVDTIDLESADALEQTVTLDGGPRTVRVPRPLLNRPVVVVPTLRYGATHPIVGGIVTAARPARISTSVASSVTAATLAIDPAGVVLDGTYTYTGRPDETGVLVAGPDVVEADYLAAELVDIDPSGIPSLAAVPETEPEPVDPSGLSISSIRDILPNESPPETDTPGLIVRRGYELYTRLTGDGYPPQFNP